MRGKDFLWLLWRLPRGITPAYAGEKTPRRSSTNTGRGSPPRRRANVTWGSYDESRRGVPPRGAGKSHQGGGTVRRQGEHPRVCGEKSFFQRSRGLMEGSPPRMRGKAGLGFSDGLPPRITPAYAGKRPGFSGPFLPTGDHPRVCGEKSNVCHRDTPFLGSPPRVRGKGVAGKGGILRCGITPARAGKRWVP